MKTIYLTITALALSTIGFGQNVPVDYEMGGFGASWTWTVFENASNPAVEIIANPDPSGINTSATVAKFTALQAGNPWAGCETMHGSDIGTFNITASNNIITIMVYKTKISNVGIKLVTSTNAALPEILVANTLVNEWEQLTFDFSAHIGGMTYDQIVIFPDFTARAADDIIYFDNIWGPTVCAPTSSMINVTSCDQYTSPSGNVLTSSGMYNDTISNAGGCDSIISIDLTVNTVVNTVSQNGETLMANELVSAYQWLACDNNYAVIPGEVNQSYTATTNGNYAVEITKNGCVDTSACVAITGLSIESLDVNAAVKVYPNPSNGIFTIDAEMALGTVYVMDIAGQIVHTFDATNKTTILDLTALTNGVYFLKAEGNDMQFTRRILKQ